MSETKEKPVEKKQEKESESDPYHIQKAKAEEEGTQAIKAIRPAARKGLYVGAAVVVIITVIISALTYPSSPKQSIQKVETSKKSASTTVPLFHEVYAVDTTKVALPDLPKGPARIIPIEDGKCVWVGGSTPQQIVHACNHGGEPSVTSADFVPKYLQSGEGVGMVDVSVIVCPPGSHPGIDKCL